MLRKITLLLFSSVFAKGLQFVYFFLAANALSKEAFGQYTVSITLFILTAQPLLEFGTELLVTKSSANGDDSKFYQITIWKLIIFPVLLSMIVTWGFFFWEIPFDLLLAAGFMIFTRSLEIGFMALLRGKRKNHIESIHLSCSRALSLSLLIIWIFLFSVKLQVLHVVLFQIIGLFIPLMILFTKTLKISEFLNFRWIDLKPLLKQGAPLALSSITWLIYFKVDILLISKLVGTEDAGVYEIAYKGLEALFIIPAMIMAVFFSQLASEKKILEYKQTFVKAILTLLGLAIVAQVGTFFIAPKLLPFYLREDQLEVIPILKVLSWTIIPVYLAYLTTQLLILQENSKIYLRITISGALLNVVLNLLLIPDYKLYGAAFATVVTELFILVVSFYYSMNKFGEHLEKKEYSKAS
ncbi:MAG: PST family polysaccharide transporter [bacterium]|jgi:PST family polysaccharide transporter